MNGALWIWSDTEQKKDSYVSFKQSFISRGGKVSLKLIAETNYVAYLNGKRIAFGQFAGFPYCKYYDVIDLTDSCNSGENLLEIVVWYEGLNTFTHIDDGAGLIFSVEEDGKQIAFSSENTLSGTDNSYVQGREKLLSIQIGYTSAMNAEKTVNYAKSRVIEKNCELRPRPVLKLTEKEFLSATHIGGGIYDLGAESVGYVVLETECAEEKTVTVAYGEHLYFGGVARILPGGYLNKGRDFSLDFNCKKGLNRFEQLFVRIAGRYLHIEPQDGLTVKRIGIIPVEYPQTEKPSFLKGVDKAIYDVAVRTLKLCMHEHYEDCPWREQSLYVLDSRNQMLCGYYAFEGTKFQRENLAFIAKSKITELLELTYPAINTPAIPFFSVMYIVSVWEYVEHTGDKSILDEVFDALNEIMQAFVKRIRANGLISTFPAPYWNFYEWTEGSDFSEELVPDCKRVERFDLILNCAYVYAAERFEKLCAIKNVKADLKIESVKNGIEREFFEKESGLFCLGDNRKGKHSQLGNAFALLIGLGDSRTVSSLMTEECIPATLSMLGYVYDALIISGSKEAERFIIEDIRRKYTLMLDAGATSFWETLGGVSENDKACSLCHGWSSIPVYYYNLFKDSELLK